MFRFKRITSAGELDNINTVDLQQQPTQNANGVEIEFPLNLLILDSDCPRAKVQETHKVLGQVNLTEAQSRSGACEASTVETTADKQLAATGGDDTKRKKKKKLIVAPETQQLVKTCIEIQT